MILDTHNKTGIGNDDAKQISISIKRAGIRMIIILDIISPKNQFFLHTHSFITYVFHQISLAKLYL